MRALLFDLGGVVIDIDFEQLFACLEKMSPLSTDEIKSRFKMDEQYRLHETGHVSWPHYAGHLRATFELLATDDEIADAWNSIFKGINAPVVESIESVKDDFPCYLFSNTNPTHQNFWQHAYPDVIAMFDRVFVSSDLGRRKPDHASFKLIAEALGTDLKDFVFFDDTAENVDAASSIGMQAVLVERADTVRLMLAKISQDGESETSIC